MVEVLINSNENYLHIDNNIMNNPNTHAHSIEREESVDIMDTWYEVKQDDTNANGKYNVINVFSGRSKASTKVEINEIIKRLCVSDLEKILSLEYDYSFAANACDCEGGIC